MLNVTSIHSNACKCSSANYSALQTILRLCRNFFRHFLSDTSFQTSVGKLVFEEPLKVVPKSMLWLKWLLGAGSLYVFHKGFLLARVSLPNISDVPPLKLKLKHDRIVIMLLDAMRFDFVSPSARLYSSRLQPPSMSSMSQLANTGQAQLLHFVADAPTTTL